MKLCICGNGFDLHHGLKTSYADYCRFLNRRDPSLLKKIAREESFSGLGKELSNPYDAFWTDVENNYTFDYDSMIADNMEESYPSDMQDGDGKWTDMDCEAEAKQKELSKFSLEYFNEWINEINVNDTLLYSVMKLNPSDLFVTFNYTCTLEKIYSIPVSNILHLHGDTSAPQFGCPHVDPQKIETELTARYKEKDFYDVSIKPAISRYVKLASAVSKDLKSNVPRLANYLKGKVISEIVILGHSYNGVDKYYYDNVFLRFYSNIPWIIYCRTFREEVCAKDFFSRNKINGSIIQW